ncbi:Asp23/Gls24 family envelope stress response protein [Corynebacterium guangdongense]|uniref:Alkaline shock family protein YloU n=1 Tax=Corynebacterium guangdongense TaxID=1783348 RepID=A0ABU1ZU91_9CORY|nr:Asp23/Gls24 family envelope stress response protein [Corynebacterium guangdongense]MDR7328499.1 putative alkaline shock family protein YloU [Corynebacterium guangdongense]WJZ17076.1 hypothetical protein CGUA_02400 [Corynebacterium guangdongense]
MTGRTRFSDKALTKVVNAAASSVPGVVTVTSSWADIGTRSYPRCEVRSDQLAGVVQVSSFIAVAWPSPATDVAARVQRSISSWVTALTGLRCTQVNVTVEQAVDAGRRVHATEVARAPDSPALRPVQVRRAGPVVSPVTARPLRVRVPETRPPRPLTPVPAPRPAPLREVARPPTPRLRPVRTPLAAPLRPVQLPPVAPLRPVTIPDVPAPPIVLRRPRPLTPVYVRGVRFTPTARQGGRRVR